MGLTMKLIQFFTEDVTIRPHSATDAKYLDRPVSIREFAQGKPCSLDVIEETGELIVRLQDGSFIQGSEWKGGGEMDVERIKAGRVVINEIVKQVNYPTRGAKASDKRIVKALMILGLTKEEAEEVIKV